MVCLECNKQVANSNNVLARHLRSMHKIEWVDYVIKHEHAGSWPVCSCGCGEKLTWRKGGFGLYVNGHDAKGTKQQVQGLGWIINPFTGHEEYTESDDELSFLKHCITNNDPVTLEHTVSIPWISSRGAKLSMKTAFNHMNHQLLITFDDFSDPEGDRRLSAIRTWCNVNHFTLLSLKRQQNEFLVVGGIKDAKTQS